MSSPGYILARYTLVAERDNLDRCNHRLTQHANMYIRVPSSLYVFVFVFPFKKLWACQVGGPTGELLEPCGLCLGLGAAFATPFFPPLKIGAGRVWPARTHESVKVPYPNSFD